ncbi:hypothetical protein K443DRAFT_37993, partial [Laccaria amethystina LaAM-08-1]
NGIQIPPEWFRESPGWNYNGMPGTESRRHMLTLDLGVINNNKPLLIFYHHRRPQHPP